MHTFRTSKRQMAVAFTTLVACTSMAACSASKGASSTAVASNCKPAHQFTTVTKGTLTAGSFELPPFVIFASNGSATGLDADMWTAIAKMECLSLKVTSGTQASAIQAVEAGRVDLMGGDTYRTADRAKVLTLSAPVWLDQMGIVSKAGYDDLNQLKGKKVGTLNGDLWNTDITALYGAGNIATYAGDPGMYADVRTGRIDAALEGVAPAKAAAKGLQVKPALANSVVKASTAAGQSNYPMNKASSALAAAVDADIATLRANGTMAQIAQRYQMPTSITQPGNPRLL